MNYKNMQKTKKDQEIEEFRKGMLKEREWTDYTKKTKQEKENDVKNFRRQMQKEDVAMRREAEMIMSRISLLHASISSPSLFFIDQVECLESLNLFDAFSGTMSMLERKAEMEEKEEEASRYAEEALRKLETSRTQLSEIPEYGEDAEVQRALTRESAHGNHSYKDGLVYEDSQSPDHSPQFASTRDDAQEVPESFHRHHFSNSHAARTLLEACSNGAASLSASNKTNVSGGSKAAVSAAPSVNNVNASVSTRGGGRGRTPTTAVSGVAAKTNVVKSPATTVKAPSAPSGPSGPSGPSQSASSKTSTLKPIFYGSKNVKTPGSGCSSTVSAVSLSGLVNTIAKDLGTNYANSAMKTVNDDRLSPRRLVQQQKATQRHYVRPGQPGSTKSQTRASPITVSGMVSPMQ